MDSGYKLFVNIDQKIENFLKEKETFVTVGVPFKDRLDVLSQTLLSIIFQTKKPQEIILVDDSHEPKDLRQLPAYQSIFQLFDYHKIEWRLIYGRRAGQHLSHDIIQKEAKYPIIWRIDSDEIAEKNVLEKLLFHWGADIGAVGGLVPQNCPPPFLPPNAANLITNLNIPNIQWFQHPDNIVKEVDHLTSSFIFRKGIVNYELSLSPASFREETLLTYELKRKGFKLLVDPSVITWHFRSPDRHQDIRNWEADDKLFYSKLQEWGVHGEQVKYVVLDCGIGDHIIIANLIPKLKEKYKKLIIANCFPEIFHNFVDMENIELISIAEAQQRLGHLDRFNIYKHCIDLNHKTELIHAFENLYEI